MLVILVALQTSVSSLNLIRQDASYLSLFSHATDQKDEAWGGFPYRMYPNGVTYLLFGEGYAKGYIPYPS